MICGGRVLERPGGCGGGGDPAGQHSGETRVFSLSATCFGVNREIKQKQLRVKWTVSLGASSSASFPSVLTLVFSAREPRRDRDRERWRQRMRTHDGEPSPLTLS